MRLARESRDHQAVADGATAVAATVAVAKAARDAATRNSRALPRAFVVPAKRARLAARVAVFNADSTLTRVDAARRLQSKGWKTWAGLDSNQRRRKASRFTVCPVWPLRYLPV